MKLTHFTLRITAVWLTIGILAIVLTGLTGCKTTEANYRAAYEKARAAKDESTPLDSTIYGRFRKEKKTNTFVIGNDTLECKTVATAITPDQGIPREWLRRYSVVAGQFKQKFNALSLAERLRDAGYPRSFVVHDAEPYYFVLCGSFDKAEEAASLLRDVSKKQPVAIKSPLPYILVDPRR